MSEAELTATVINRCEQLGLLYHHCPNSTRCKGPAGFPDLFIAGQRGLLLPELKSESGETSPEQELWAWTITRARMASECRAITGYRIWRPADLDNGTITASLELIK